MHAFSDNKHFLLSKSCHCQTHQNHEESQQKFGAILGNKVCTLKKKNSKSWSPSQIFFIFFF